MNASIQIQNLNFWLHPIPWAGLDLNNLQRCLLVRLSSDKRAEIISGIYSTSAVLSRSPLRLGSFFRVTVASKIAACCSVVPTTRGKYDFARPRTSFRTEFARFPHFSARDDGPRKESCLANRPKSRYSKVCLLTFMPMLLSSSTSISLTIIKHAP